MVKWLLGRNLKLEGRVFFFFQHQLHMRLVLSLAAHHAAVPAVEHPADGRIPRVACHPDVPVVLLPGKMLLEQLEVLALAFVVGVLVDRVLVFTDIFAGFAPGERRAVRQPSGDLEEHRGGS